MAVTTDNVKLGVCDVTFNSVDLGATKGGVEVEIQTETYEVKVDQYGETPIKDVIIGTMVTVKVPMAESDLVKLKEVMPQAVALVDGMSATKGLEIRSGVNTDLLDGAAELVLHPTGLSALDLSQDFTVFLAAPTANFTFKYATGEERIYEVTFKGYPDVANNGKIAAFGDPSPV
ncbi:MAG: hypothetical protein LPL29_02190 [Alphaproteobacteria bacterium]|nr:hypothetical protein [Alphaproteobacteria bacterium]